MDECVVINVRLRAEIDDSVPATLKIPYQIKWPDFDLLLKLNFECTSIAVRFVDEDGDKVIISDQDGLFEAFRHARFCGNVLHLIIDEIEPETSVKALEATCNNSSTQPSYINTAAMASGDTPPSYATAVECCNNVGLNVISELSLEGAVGETCIKEKLVKFDFPSPPSTEPGSLAAESGASPAIVILSEQELWESQETGEKRRENSVHIDKETGAVEFRCHQSRPKKKKSESHSAKEAKETGEARRSHSQPDESRKKRHKRRSSEAEGREGRPVAHDDSVVSYSALVEFLDKLKTDLRTEIVRDVTRKTVKQVLKGLDGAVIQTVQGTSGVPITTTSQTSPDTPTDETEKTNNLRTHSLYCHDGIVCDNCDQTIVGSRYKCGNCLDYDLCEQCEALDGIHTSDHVFLKIRRPCLGAGHVGGTCVPLLRCCIYDSLPVPSLDDSMLSAEATSLTNSTSILVPKWERLKEEMHRIKEQIKKERQSFKKQIKKEKQEEKLRLKMSYDRHDSKSRKENLERLRNPRKLDAQFISDVTVPDETCVQPGTRLTKSWLIRNTGNIIWSENTKLRMMWGNMAAVATEVSVPHLEPGKQDHVTVELIAPNEPGRYQSHWKMFDNSVNFGHRVWCVILVQPKEVLEPTKESSLKVVAEYETIQETVDEVTNTRHESVHEVSPIPCVIIDEETPLLLQPENLVLPLTPVLIETDCTVATTVEPRSELVEVISETTTQNDDKVETDLNNAIASLKIIGIDVTASISLCDVDTEANKALNTDSSQVEADGNDKADEEENRDEINQRDLMSFEMLDLNRDREAKAPKASQTATPNNTPLVMSPPKSPVLGSPAEKAIISSSSSVEMVNDDGMSDEVLSPTMTDYVQQRMASLGLKPNVNVELESISSMSDDSFDDEFSDSSGSDGDFFIVPLPDCFDPNKPLTKSMVITVQSEQASNEHQDTVTEQAGETARSLPVWINAGRGEDDDDQAPVACSSTITTSSSSSSSCSSSNTATTTVTSLPQTYEETHVVKTQDANGETIVTTTTIISTTNSSSTTSVTNEADVVGDAGDNSPHSLETASDAGAGKKTITINLGEIESRAEAAAEEAARTDAESQAQKDAQRDSTTAGEGHPCESDHEHALPSPSDFANHLVVTAVHAAARAATQAYSTARDVFWTLQAKNAQQNGGTPTPAPRRHRGKAPGDTKPDDQEKESATNMQPTETLSQSQDSNKDNSANKSPSEQQEQQQASESDKKDEQPSNKDHHDGKQESSEKRWNFWQPPPPDLHMGSANVHVSHPHVEVSWMPPPNNWQPPPSNWMPPPNNWTPPPNKWQPPPPFMPPHASPPPPPPPFVPPPHVAPPPPPFSPPPHAHPFMQPPSAHAPPHPPPLPEQHDDLQTDSMTHLMEMGFYNRDLNSTLLQTFDNDLEKVVQELVKKDQNDWHTRRH